MTEIKHLIIQFLSIFITQNCQLNIIYQILNIYQQLSSKNLIKIISFVFMSDIKEFIESIPRNKQTISITVNLLNSYDKSKDNFISIEKSIEDIYILNPTIFICNYFSVLAAEVTLQKTIDEEKSEDQEEQNVGDLPPKLEFLVQILDKCLDNEGNRVEIELLHHLVDQFCILLKQEQREEQVQILSIICRFQREQVLSAIIDFIQVGEVPQPFVVRSLSQIASKHADLISHKISEIMSRMLTIISLIDDDARQLFCNFFNNLSKGIQTNNFNEENHTFKDNESQTHMISTVQDLIKNTWKGDDTYDPVVLNTLGCLSINLPIEHLCINFANLLEEQETVLESQDLSDILEVVEGQCMCINVVKVRLSTRDQSKYIDAIQDSCYGQVEFIRNEMQQVDFTDNEQIQQSKKLINANSSLMVSWNQVSMMQQSKSITQLLEKIKEDSQGKDLGLFLLNKLVIASKAEISNQALKEIITSLCSLVMDEDGGVTGASDELASLILDLWQSLCKNGLLEKSLLLDTHDIKMHNTKLVEFVFNNCSNHLCSIGSNSNLRVQLKICIKESKNIQVFILPALSMQLQDSSFFDSFPCQLSFLTSMLSVNKEQIYKDQIKYNLNIYTLFLQIFVHLQMPLPWQTVNQSISMKKLNEGLDQLALLLDFLKLHAPLINEAFIDINQQSLIDVHARIKQTKELEIESWQEYVGMILNQMISKVRKSTFLDNIQDCIESLMVQHSENRIVLSSCVYFYGMLCPYFDRGSKIKMALENIFRTLHPEYSVSNINQENELGSFDEFLRDRIAHAFGNASNTHISLCLSILDDVSRAQVKTAKKTGFFSMFMGGAKTGLSYDLEKTIITCLERILQDCNSREIIKFMSLNIFALLFEKFSSEDKVDQIKLVQECMQNQTKLVQELHCDENVNIRSQIANTINIELTDRVIALLEKQEASDEEFLQLCNIFINFCAVKDSISQDQNEKIFVLINKLVDQILIDTEAEDQYNLMLERCRECVKIQVKIKSYTMDKDNQQRMFNFQKLVEFLVNKTNLVQSVAHRSKYQDLKSILNECYTELEGIQVDIPDDITEFNQSKAVQDCVTLFTRTLSNYFLMLVQDLDSHSQKNFELLNLVIGIDTKLSAKEDRCEEFRQAQALGQWGMCALEPQMQNQLQVFCNQQNEVVLRDFLINSFESLKLQTNDTCIIDQLKFITGIVRFRIANLKTIHVKMIIEHFISLATHILENCRSEAAAYNELLFRVFLEILSKHSEAWLEFFVKNQPPFGRGVLFFLDRSANNLFLLQKFFSFLTNIINNVATTTEGELKAVSATHILGTLLGTVNDTEIRDMIKDNFHSILGTIIIRIGQVKSLDKEIIVVQDSPIKSPKKAMGSTETDESDEASEEDDDAIVEEKEPFDFDRDVIETLRSLLICINDSKILMLLENIGTQNLLANKDDQQEGIQQLIGMQLKTQPAGCEKLLNFILPFASRANENQRVVALSVITMLVCSEMIDQDLRVSVIEKHILTRINDLNVLVKKLVIRGIRLVVEKYRELEYQKKMKLEIEGSIKNKNNKIKPEVNAEDDSNENDEQESNKNKESESEEDEDIQINKTLLARLFELSMGTLNNDDERVVAESLGTLKSLLHCWRALELTRQVPTLIQKLKKFQDIEHEGIRLTAFIILQLIFEISKDAKASLGDKTHQILLSICLHLFDSNTQVKAICIDLVKLVAVQAGIILTEQESKDLDSFHKLKVSTENESVVVQQIDMLQNTFFIQHSSQIDVQIQECMHNLESEQSLSRLVSVAILSKLICELMKGRGNSNFDKYIDRLNDILEHENDQIILDCYIKNDFEIKCLI